LSSAWGGIGRVLSPCPHQFYNTRNHILTMSRIVMYVHQIHS
jgi:hypothetical protein